jgi:hypothetical protein
LPEEKGLDKHSSFFGQSLRKKKHLYIIEVIKLISLGLIQRQFKLECLSLQGSSGLPSICVYPQDLLE